MELLECFGGFYLFMERANRNSWDLPKFLRALAVLLVARSAVFEWSLSWLVPD